MRKGISFIDNSVIKEFNLGKRKLHLNKKGNSAFAKKLLHHINRNKKGNSAFAKKLWHYINRTD